MSNEMVRVPTSMCERFDASMARLAATALRSMQGDLHEAADRVAGEAELMLHGDLGGIFLFFDGQSRQLTHGRRGHRAGRADLGLAAAFRAGDRGVVPDKVAEQTRHAERFGDLAVGQVVFLLHIHEHGGQHTAAAAGGRGDDGAVPAFCSATAKA